MSGPGPDIVGDWLQRARSELSQYAVQTRYPGEWEPVTKNEAIEALERAALVLAWVEGKVG